MHAFPHFFLYSARSPLGQEDIKDGIIGSLCDLSSILSVSLVRNCLLLEQEVVLMPLALRGSAGAGKDLLREHTTYYFADRDKTLMQQ